MPLHRGGWTRRRAERLVVTAALAAWAALASAATAYAQADSPAAEEAIALPGPTGRYGVGTIRRAMTDTTRGEPTTDDPTDHRELVVQFWYPTEEAAIPTGPYMDTATARTWVERHGFPAGFQRSILTHARTDTPVAAGAHPTLIFSHGLSWPVLMYQTYLEDLASHGYVVAAVNHTYGADMVVFPGGRRTEFDLFPPGLADTEEARDSVLVEKVEEWALDLRFVADELEGITGGAGPLAGSLDPSRLGVFGHSFGGSAAALVLEDDPRFAAGLGMESTVRDPDARPLVVPRPFMHVVGGFNRGEMAGVQYRAGPAPYYEVVVEGMWHSMFSDLILLYAELGADAEWLARHAWEMPPDRGIQITRDLIRAFFDRWLRGEDSPLLHPWWPPDPASALTSPYPEVELRIDYGTPDAEEAMDTGPG